MPDEPMHPLVKLGFALYVGAMVLDAYFQHANGSVQFACLGNDDRQVLCIGMGDWSSDD